MLCQACMKDYVRKCILTLYPSSPLENLAPYHPENVVLTFYLNDHLPCLLIYEHHLYSRSNCICLSQIVYMFKNLCK